MNTDDFIKRLAEANAPVRRLRPPWMRALLWLALAVPYVALVVWLHPHTPSLLPWRLDTWVIVEWTAAFVTGGTAAWAAFCSTIPGYDRRILWIPALPAAVWAGTLGVGCISDWLRFGLAGLTLRPDWGCLPPAILIGSVPLVAIIVMLRRGAPLHPQVSVLLAALAVAGIGNAGLRMYHPGDAAILILVWHVGVAFALTALLGLLGKAVFSWERAVGRLRRLA